MADRPAENPSADAPSAFLEFLWNSAETAAFLRSVMAGMMADLPASPEMGWAFSVLRGGHTVTWEAADARAATIDRLQHSFDDSPALTAIRSGEFVHVSNTALDRRWPGYASVVVGYGVLSLLSLPLDPEGVLDASVNLYWPLPHAYTSESIITALNYAGQLSLGLRLAIQLFQKQVSYPVPVPAGSPTLVDSAVTILIDEFGLSHEAALHYLRLTARSMSATLEQAALDIVLSHNAPHRYDHIGTNATAPATKARRRRTPFGPKNSA
ncbi:hypothetical protein [Arthrobacter sp. 92]|uniref:hypothetical protein n=1 Tax=Arthrobacter sp. 92 TaxID=3418175 RepID=UPI003D05F4A4